MDFFFPESWSEIHPGIVTIPVDWPYRMPFGLIYSKHPSPAFERFINMLDAFDSSKRGGCLPESEEIMKLAPERNEFEKFC